MKKIFMGAAFFPFLFLPSGRDSPVHLLFLPGGRDIPVPTHLGEKKNKMPIPPRGSRELRKGRFSQAGGYYFVTASTFEREKFFVQPEIADLLIRAIHWMEDQARWTWEMYMIMPDHAHLVFRLGEGETLASAMKSWKGYTAREILKVIGTRMSLPQTGIPPLAGGPNPPLYGRPLQKPIHLWQEGYYDRFIRTEPEFQAVLKYMAYNPVRAGLAASPEDYPYWKSKIDFKF